MGNKDKTLKGFKVTDTNRSRLCGVACRNFEELLQKGCLKLKIEDSKCVTVHLLDGTVIDSENYFSTVTPQTVLVFAKDGEKIVTGADIIYNALKLVNLEVIKAGEAISKFFDEDIKAKIRTLSEILNKPSEEDDLVLASKKEDHPEWFIGTDSNARTKEEFLEKRCQDRIRSYLYKSISDWRSTNAYKDNIKTRQAFEEIIKKLKEELLKNRYCGVYFVRGCQGAICNAKGEFICNGVWYSDKCTHERGEGHKINPYRSRDHRIIFSTWNLDHRIERSRTIIPTVTELLTKNGYNQINIHYIYRLLFTTENLKLVHIVCHDKSAHVSAKCDLEEMIRVDV